MCIRDRASVESVELRSWWEEGAGHWSGGMAFPYVRQKVEDKLWPSGGDPGLITSVRTRMSLAVHKLGNGFVMVAVSFRARIGIPVVSFCGFGGVVV